MYMNNNKFNIPLITNPLFTASGSNCISIEYHKNELYYKRFIGYNVIRFSSITPEIFTRSKFGISLKILYIKNNPIFSPSKTL